jgi:hypothetical protein
MKNLMERFVQQIKDRTECFDDHFPCRRRKENCDSGSICMELAKIIPTVLAYGNGQSAVHDIRGKGWWLS